MQQFILTAETVQHDIRSSKTRNKSATFTQLVSVFKIFGGNGIDKSENSAAKT